MAIHEKIRKLREAKDLTQENLAHELGVSLKTYGRWESGETPIKLNDFLRISTILDIPAEDLISSNPVTVNIEKQDIQTKGIGLQSGTVTNNYWNEEQSSASVDERLTRLEAAVEKLLKQLPK